MNTRRLLLKREYAALVLYYLTHPKPQQFKFNNSALYLRHMGAYGAAQRILASKEPEKLIAEFKPFVPEIRAAIVHTRRT